MRHIAVGVMLISLLISCSQSVGASDTERLLSNSSVVHGFSWERYNVFVFHEGKSAEEDVGILVADDSNHVVAEAILPIGGTWVPVAFNSRCLSIGGFWSADPSGYSILTFDSTSDSVFVHQTGYVFLGNLGLDDQYLYYSSEYGFPSVNRVRLATGERQQYSERYLPNARFVPASGTMYAIQSSETPQAAFAILDSGLVLDSSVEVEDPGELTLSVMIDRSPATIEPADLVFHDG